MTPLDPAAPRLPAGDEQPTPVPGAQPPAAGTAPSRLPLRSVVIPTEHGSWAFLAEPVALGLLVAPSPAALLVAAAAIGAFFARRPLRILVTDRREGRRTPRTALARRAFALLALAAAGALAGAVQLSRGPVLLAVGLAAPFAAAALAFDLARRTREAAAEVAAALALGAVAPAAVLAAGFGTAPALALWAILAARAVPSILYVRARLRLDRGEPAHVTGALAAHVVAVLCVAALALASLGPWLAMAAMVGLALRAWIGLSPGRPRLAVKQLGASEIVAGALTVVAVWLGIVLRM
jgi:hypothetical protein